MASEFDIDFTPTYQPGLTPPSTVPVPSTRLTDAAANAAVSSSMGMPNRATVFYSPTRDAYFLGGREVASRDEAALLEAAYATNPADVYDPPAGDWQAVDNRSFASFIDKIANPDLGRRFTKNFESATAGMGVLAGAGARFLGAEDLGSDWMEAGSKRMGELSPYDLSLEDVDGSRSRGAVDWFVGVLGQFGPSIVETVVSAAIGAGVGALAGGGPNPLSAAGGVLAGLSGKEAIKQGVLAAAKKHLAGEALDATERKLLREQASIFAAALDSSDLAKAALARSVAGTAPKLSAFGDDLARGAGGAVVPGSLGAARTEAQNLLRRGTTQSIVGGAGVVSAANSYAMGVSDVYREGLESGSPDRGLAAALGVPYAALDLLPEFLVARRVFGDIGAAAGKKLSDLNGTKAKAGELLKRGGKGFVTGAALEGATEASQEGLLLAANPLVDFNSPEGLSRLLNSFAAGAAIGGPIGSLVNLKDSKQPANLLQPTANVNPTPAAPAATAAPTPSLPSAPSGGFNYGGPRPSSPPGPAELSGSGIPYADYSEVGANDALSPPAIGLPSPAQPAYGQGVAQLAAPVPAAPVDPRAQMAAQQAMREQVVPPPETPDPFLAEARNSWLARQNADIQNNFVAQQRQARAEAPKAAKLKAKARTAKLGKAEPVVAERRMTAQQGLEASDFREWLNVNSADPRITEIVDEALANGDFDTIQQMMELTGYNEPTPQPPTPKKSLRKATKAKDAKPSTAPPVKGAALKAGKINALKNGTADARSQAAAAGVRAQEANPQPTGSRTERAAAGSTTDTRSPAGAAAAGERTARAASASTARASGERPADGAAARASAAKATEEVKADGQYLDSAIDEVDLGSVSALEDVLYYAYPDKDDGIDASLTDRARDYLNRTTFSASQKAYIDRNGKHKKAPEPEQPKPKPSSTTRLTQLERLMAFLDEFVQNPDLLNDRSQRLLAQAKIGALVSEAAKMSSLANVLRTPFNGKTIGDYVTTDKNINGTIKATLNIEQDVELDTYRLVAEADREVGNFIRVRDGYARGHPSDSFASLASGKIRLIVNSFLSQLKVAPKVSIYRNVADFKARNPELFRRAAAARKQGDFETTRAMGYSFGDQVIVFTDFIKTEHQLRVVLAHEALGHFGLRAVLDKAELTRVLDNVLAYDARVRGYINKYVEMGYDKYEAIEEFLADAAAELEVSLLKRVWTALKNALNKIGLRFEDDMSRQLISQIRRYARTGEGGFFSAQTMAENMARLQQEADEGRFAAILDGHTLASSFTSMSELSYSAMRGFENIRDWADSMVKSMRDKRTGYNLKDAAAEALEAVQTLNNKATRSEGLSLFYQMFQEQARRARFLLSEYNSMLKETQKTDTYEPHRTKAGKLLAYAALRLSRQLDAKTLDDYGNLIVTDDFGANPRPNPDVLNRLKKDGLLSRDDFIRGFDIETAEGPQPFTLASVGMTEADLAEDGKVWKIYLEQRDAVVRAAVDLVMANYEQAAAEHVSTFDRLAGLRYNSPFEKRDRETLEQITATYRKIMLEGADTSKPQIVIKPESREKADKFLIDVTRAFSNEEVLKSWKDVKAKVDDANKVDDAVRAYGEPILDRIEAIYGKGVSTSNMYNIQAGIRNLGLLEVQTRDAERYAKRTILSSYVPFRRRGKYQLRLAAYDDKGRLMPLAASIKAVMPYYRNDDHNVLQRMSDELAKTFSPDKIWTLRDVDGKEVKVTLKPEVSVGKQGMDFQGIVNLNDFVYTLERLDIRITPAERERIVTALTAHGESARRNLMRSGNPGWDPDVLRSVAEWLETSAHVSAKRLYQNRIHDVLTHDSLWRGQDEKLAAKKREWEQETNPERKLRLKRDYEQYAYMYRHMKAEGHTVEVNGKELPTLGMGERYRTEAETLLKWYDEQVNISDETDIFTNEMGSKLKTAVVLAQLGGTLATAAVNTVSMLTHSIPYAAFYNPDLASGMGFGLGHSARNVWRALSDVKNYGLGNADTLKQLRDSGAYAKYNLTRNEIEFLLEQTETGALQAALPDALLGTARGKIVSPRAQKAIQLWMSMFSYTEQLNRRVTALAVYRMEYQRSIAEGLSEEAARRSAERAALKAVDDTQGEYAMFNRPKMARGNLLSYVFMYKMFPILTVQMIRRLPMKGKLMVLAMLLLASGLKGIPFADDIMDLLDTLLQKLGIKIGSVEATLHELFDEILPGSSQFMMRGLLDRWTGATLSTRLGMGDLVPLTGVFKAGADPWRETQNFLGPMAGGLFGFVNSVGALAGMGVDTLGGRPSNLSLIDIMRQSPIAAARALGDTFVYADNGAVVNSSGRVVDPEMGPMTLIFRTLGFYPASATRANDMVRVGKQARDYMLEVSKSFKDAYIKAALVNNRAVMSAIEDEVDRWNDDAKGTGLEIANFRESTRRALKEARLPAGERFLKTTPLGMRERTAEWMRLYGVEE